MSLFSPDLPDAPQMFFVYPVNARYLEGNATRIRTRHQIDLIGHGMVLILMLLVGLTFAASSLTYWRVFTPPLSSEQMTTLGATACFALIPLILVLTGIPGYRKRVREGRRRRQMLKAKGQIIVGEVISYEALSFRNLLVPHSGPMMRYRFHPPGQPEVIHAYRLPSYPFFREPKPGMPMALLYVDETLYEIL
jgi:hypothetical protein